MDYLLRNMSSIYISEPPTKGKVGQSGQAELEVRDVRREQLYQAVLSAVGIALHTLRPGCSWSPGNMATCTCRRQLHLQSCARSLLLYVVRCMS